MKDIIADDETKAAFDRLWAHAFHHGATVGFQEADANRLGFFCIHQGKPNISLYRQGFERENESTWRIYDDAPQPNMERALYSFAHECGHFWSHRDQMRTPDVMKAYAILVEYMKDQTTAPHMSEVDAKRIIDEETLAWDHAIELLEAIKWSRMPAVKKAKADGVKVYDDIVAKRIPP